MTRSLPSPVSLLMNSNSKPALACTRSSYPLRAISRRGAYLAESAPHFSNGYHMEFKALPRELMAKQHSLIAREQEALRAVAEAKQICWS
jgi:hypothetical protein